MEGNPKAVANCERPKCAAYEFGKGHRRPNKINKIKKNPMKEKELKKDHLLPGQMVSADYYISRAPGGSTTQNGNQINPICYQEDVYLLTMPVDM